MLTGATLTKLWLNDDDDFGTILKLVKDANNEGVSEYLRNCDRKSVNFYRLEPPPQIDDLDTDDSGDLLKDAGAVLAQVEKIVLKKTTSLGRLFDAPLDRRTVSLYLEKTGFYDQFLFLWPRY